MKKGIKIFLSVWLCLAILGTIGFFTMGNIILNFTLSKRMDCCLTGNTFIEQTAKEIYTTAEDGVSLHGYLTENINAQNKVAIICHGYSDSAIGVSNYASQFYSLGFSTLCPDARAHGKSGGDLIGMGYLEKRDIICWIKEFLRLNPLTEFVIFGVSMGGATVLFASGESDLPPQVKAVIADSAFTDVYNVIGNIMQNMIPFIPKFPVIDSASVVCEMKGGYSFRDASCVQAVKRSNTPTLFIHGNADTFVPFYMLGILYENATCEKEKLVIENAGHIQGAQANPLLYWSSVDEFLKDKF